MVSNPTVTEGNPAGRFFGQMVNGRIYYLGEDPFCGSHDFDWDEAICRPMNTYAYQFDGERVVRAYAATLKPLVRMF